jgi:hypothetical protein
VAAAPKTTKFLGPNYHTFYERPFTAILSGDLSPTLPSIQGTDFDHVHNTDLEEDNSFPLLKKYVNLK